MSDLLSERHGNVLVLTLNRPDANNSITADLYKGLLESLREASLDDRVRAVVTRAVGRNWCVGADARDLKRFPDIGLRSAWLETFAGRIGLDERTEQDTADIGIGRWVLAVTDFVKPWIASIGGAAAGGGLGLAALHHFRVASRTAKFTTAFGKLGLGPEMGLSATLPALVGRQAAMNLLLTSRLVDADEAARLGLIDSLVTDGSLDEKTMDFAEQIGAQAPKATRAVLRGQSVLWRGTLREHLAREWADQTELFASADFKEGVAAFLNHRPPHFKGG
jgi:enoyl-CoA hydratase/carnithine racemase